MAFEADIEHISTLDSVMLVQLMKRLMLAECRLAGVPLRSASAPLQVTVADGGEDGRVEWTGGLESTGYFPNRFSIFQSKAQNLTESAVKAEVLKGGQGTPKRLSEAIAEVLSRRGAYIVFCSNPFPDRKKAKLHKAIESAIREGGGDPSQAAAIEIYDANQIGDWVNTHPSVALWLAALQRGRSLTGFHSHESWGRSPEIYGVPWAASDTPRFLSVNQDIPAFERKDRTRNAWTFDQAATSALGHLAQDQSILRIAGPSGFGKSRFAHEMFNRGTSVADQTDRASVVYADQSILGDETAKLALEMADARSPSTLVIDECSDEMHLKLAAIAQRAGSRLRLVTLDIETKLEQAKGTLVIRLERAADEMIEAIAKSIAPDLSDSDTRFIANLSNGFPQMAVLAAQQSGDGRQTMSSAEQVLDRTIWGRRTPNDEAYKALEILSLFDWIGLTGRVSGQAAFIAKELAGIAEDTFIEYVNSFRPRGIIVQRGDFVQVGPIPLAARLGQRRISLVPSAKLTAFFSKAPFELKRSLLKRLRWLDISPAARMFAETLLKADHLGRLAALNTDFGAECIDLLVQVDPDAAMTTIDRVLGSVSIPELHAVQAGRRHLVWALEKLVFRKESFDRAATLLRRLAAAENEERISNNASGQFKQLYQLYLSGTEAEPAARLLVLDDGLRSDNQSERELCIDALDRMLHMHHFARGGGAEQIGSGERLKDWVPKTNEEISEFYRAALTRPTEIVLAAGDPLADKAKASLGTHIRGLIGTLPFEDIQGTIDRITAHGGLWWKALQGLNEWLYFDRMEAPPDLSAKVRSYFDGLMPVDPVELADVYTSGWQTDFYDPDSSYGAEKQSTSEFEYATRKAVELAEVIARDPEMVDRALIRMVTSEGKAVFPFARRLAEVSADPLVLFESALAKAEMNHALANRQFFAGLIAGSDSRDPAVARRCIAAALRSDKLKADAISMIGSGKLQPDDLRLVVSLVHAGDVRPSQCASLSYGRGLDHLLPEHIMPLLEELMGHGAEGLWTVLHMVGMYLYGGRQPDGVIVDALKRTVVHPALFTGLVRGTGDGHFLRTTVELLATHCAIDRRFARALSKQCLGLCRLGNDKLFHVLDAPVRRALRTLIGTHPKEVWAEIARLLPSKAWRVRYRLEQLFECDRDDHLGPGPLYSLPASLYLNWVRKDRKGRAATVMDWLPVVERGGEGPLCWHPALEAFVAEFGGEDEVLPALSSRLRPRSWWGSLAPHLEPLLPLVESWLQHPNAELRLGRAIRSPIFARKSGRPFSKTKRTSSA